jgi:hypothetical protein
MKIHNVIIEMEAEVIVKAIKSKSIPRSQWGQFVKQCAGSLGAKQFNIHFLTSGSSIYYLSIWRDRHKKKLVGSTY